MDKQEVTAALAISNLRVSFGENAILRGVSLAVHPGRILAVVGRSGSGKSTLLRAICGLVPIADGDVSLDGRPVIRSGRILTDPTLLRRRVMLVPQLPSLLPHLTVRDNMTLGMRIVRGMEEPTGTEQAQALAEKMGLTELLARFPNELSVGQAQRVCLARVLLLRPQVLLLDEISSALDPQTTRDVVDALWTIRKSNIDAPQSIVIVTHLLRFAASFADEIAFLNAGIVFEQGPAREIAERPQRDETRAFFQAELDVVEDRKEQVR